MIEDSNIFKYDPGYQIKKSQTFKSKQAERLFANQQSKFKKLQKTAMSLTTLFKTIMVLSNLECSTPFYQTLYLISCLTGGYLLWSLSPPSSSKKRPKKGRSTADLDQALMIYTDELIMYLMRSVSHLNVLTLEAAFSILYIILFSKFEPKKDRYLLLRKVMGTFGLSLVLGTSGIIMLITRVLVVWTIAVSASIYLNQATREVFKLMESHKNSLSQFFQLFGDLPDAVYILDVTTYRLIFYNYQGDQIFGEDDLES